MPIRDSSWPLRLPFSTSVNMAAESVGGLSAQLDGDRAPAAAFFDQAMRLTAFLGAMGGTFPPANAVEPP
jgi:hypothetical protein